jgi:hypothetical protein
MSRFKLGIVVGCGLGVFGGAMLAIWVLRDPIPPLTRTAFESARDRWKQHGIGDYDMAIVFSGGQVGDFDISVRGGDVTRLVRNGQAVADRGAAWRSLSVPGMFEILEIDLARIEERSDRGNAGEYKVSVEFDPAWGIPRRYRQIQLGGRRTTSEWQITRFIPRADE